MFRFKENTIQLNSCSMLNNFFEYCLKSLKTVFKPKNILFGLTNPQVYDWLS